MSNYVTLEDLRSNSSLGDLPVDVEAQRAIDAAEEAIESYCGRTFYQMTNATRYYTADRLYTLYPDDIVTAGTVLTDDNADGTHETTWATTDYNVGPYNAEAYGRPYTFIEVSAAGLRMFPKAIPRGVKIIGTFGWPAIPDAIVQATIIQATRFLKRARSSPFGIETVAVDGTPVRLRNKLDPDVEVMLGTLRKRMVLLK